MKIVLTVIFIMLCFSIVCLAQAKNCPNVKNKSKHIESVSNMSVNLANDSTCHLENYEGIITALTYKADQSEDISSITVELKSGQKYALNFSDENMTECFSSADRANWNSQVKKGAKVIVKAYVCGGKSDLNIFSIEFIKSNKSLIRKFIYTKKFKVKV